ncbi:AraC family transcriptional regulator [uncultured Acetobacteroides sp.]|uniref:AraC family transcriptional regulator n=1 Tax=uncultured Acetobacteroides sp. TaxID=1760811 RepID=UPI0029F4EF4E|nr:AraC family transcriptional regulator [uncultured Acetobacteroides sp.]
MSSTGFIDIYKERIHQAIDYISEHLSEDIPLEKLATVACFSPFHFHRIFSAVLGETPRDYIERSRMEKAAKLICLNQNITIADIASTCGFSSASSFTRTFKKYHGVAPTLYLQKHREEHHTPNGQPHITKSQSRLRDFSLVEIKKLPPFHVAYTQTIESYATGIPKAWNRLFQFLHPRGLITNDVALLGIPYNNPGITPREKCRYRACITVPTEVVLPRGDVKTVDLQEAVYAVYHFKGKREDIWEAYAFFYGEWLIQSGYFPDEKPLIELYPLSLMSDCAQNNLTYDIAIPVVPIGRY